MADDVQVQFGASIEKLLAGIKQSNDAVKGFADSAKSAIENLATPIQRLQNLLVGFTAIAAGGAAFKDVVQTTLDVTGAVTKLQKAFGGNLEESNKTAAALKLLGISTDDYTGYALRLDRQIRQNNQSLQQMGFTAKDLDLGQKGLMDKAIGKLLEYKEGIDRNIAAQVLFGRNVQEIYPLLRLSLEGVSARAAELHEKFSLTVTDDDKDRARSYKMAMNELGMAMEGIKKSIGDAVLPYLEQMARWFAERTPDMIAGMKELVKTVIEFAFDAARGLVSFSVSVADALVSLYRVGQYIKEALGGKANDAAVETLTNAVKKLEALRDRAIAGLNSFQSAMANGEHESSGLPSQAGSGELPKGTKRADDLLRNDDARAARMKEIDGEIKLLELGLAREKVILDAKVRQFAITENQKFALVQDATQKEYDAELGLLQKELQIGGLKTAQRQQINNRIKELESKHTTEMIKLDEQSIAAMTAKWQQALGAIESAFNSQLRGLLAGTTSWATAFKNIMGDLVIKLIEVVEKMAVEWAAAQLGMTTASTTGAAARASAEVAGQSASLPARIAKFESDLVAAASLGAANAYAALAAFPPAAAAAAAAAFEGITSLGQAGIPKLDTGGYVLRSGLAVIHEGETVTQAADVARGRGPLGAGGDTHAHFNVSAIDRGGVAAFFNQHARTLADILGRKTALNPSLKFA